MVFVLFSTFTALRRSRRRVRSVITTELPFLMSKEFGADQNYDPCGMKFPEGLPTSKIAELHQARWTALFDHMDEALIEEEKQLVSSKTRIFCHGLEAYCRFPLGQSMP